MIWMLYMEAAARLHSAVPKLKTVGWYSGQLTAPETNTTVVLPSAFFRFQPIKWRDHQSNVQVGDVTFEVIIIDRFAGDFRDGHAAQERALDNLKLLDEVQSALQGWGGGWFTKLTRVQTDLDHEPAGGWIAHIVTYATSFYDTGAYLLDQLVAATPTYVVHGDSDPAGPANATVD